MSPSIDATLMLLGREVSMMRLQAALPEFDSILAAKDQ